MEIRKEHLLTVEERTSKGTNIKIAGGKAMFHLSFGKNTDMGFYADELDTIINILTTYKRELYSREDEKILS